MLGFSTTTIAHDKPGAIKVKVIDAGSKREIIGAEVRWYDRRPPVSPSLKKINRHDETEGIAYMNKDLHCAFIGDIHPGNDYELHASTFGRYDVRSLSHVKVQPGKTTYIAVELHQEMIKTIIRPRFPAVSDTERRR